MVTKLLLAICQVYSWLIICRVMISWINPRPKNEYLLMICRLTDPFLDRLRPYNPFSGIDITPIIAFFLVKLACFILTSLFAL